MDKGNGYLAFKGLETPQEELEFYLRRSQERLNILEGLVRKSG